MALVASLYDKWFMKNYKFRRHIAENGVQNHENGMGHMQQSSLGPILPLHHVSEPYILTFPLKMQKNHNHSKSICLNVPKNLYAQICKPLQTHFPCANWHFSVFCQGELRKQPIFYILLISTGSGANAS